MKKVKNNLKTGGTKMTKPTKITILIEPDGEVVGAFKNAKTALKYASEYFGESIKSVNKLYAMGFSLDIVDYIAS